MVAVGGPTDSRSITPSPGKACAYVLTISGSGGRATRARNQAPVWKSGQNNRRDPLKLHLIVVSSFPSLFFFVVAVV